MTVALHRPSIYREERRRNEEKGKRKEKKVK